MVINNNDKNDDDINLVNYNNANNQIQTNKNSNMITIVKKPENVKNKQNC